MPAISKIRFTNVIYEGGAKRYNDDIFQFDGYNGIILLENGGGKTVFIQAAIQAVLPHQDLAERKIKDTLLLQGSSAHVAIEWIINEHPRRYAVTAVTLFIRNDNLDSYRYVYEYEAGGSGAIEDLPFVREGKTGEKRPAAAGEMQDYYYEMTRKSMLAQTFPTISAYHQYIENSFKIIPSQWKKIVDINGAEGEVEGFFEGCKTTTQLVDQLLIPTVEEALAGNGAKDFVELFDKQRSHFKEHKRLQKQLEENKSIEERVNFFVEHYQNLHREQQKWLRDKQRAKAFFELTTAEKGANERQQQELTGKYEQLKAAKETLKRKRKSFEIRKLEQEQEQLKAAYLDAREQYLEYQNQLKNIELRYQSLEIAQIRKKIREYGEYKTELEKQLQQLEQSPAAAELEQELIQVMRELKGYFVTEEQKIAAVLNARQEQLARYEENKDKLESELKQLGEKEIEIAGKLASYTEKINSAAGRMDKLRIKILINPDQEQVEAVLPQLKKEAEELEKNQWDFHKKLNELAQDKSNLDQLIRQKREDAGQLTAKATKVSSALQNIKAAEEHLKEQLMQRNPEFARYNSLYTDEASINAQVEEKVEYLYKEKQTLLNKERLAYRFIDDYQDSETFTADPLLEKLVHGWQSQFPYLELGSSFIERAYAARPDIAADTFLLWPMALITSEDDTEKLIKKLALQRKRFTHPVLVLSSRQARSFLDGLETDLTFVEPQDWQLNIYKDKFSAWKERLTGEAEEIRQQREQCDETYNSWTVLLANTRDFYNRYPYAQFAGLKQSQVALAEQQEKVKQELQQAESRLKKADEEKDLYQKRLQEAERNKNDVERRIADAGEYLEQKAVMENARKEKYEWLQEQEHNQTAKEKSNNNYRLLTNAMEEFKLGTGEIKNELKSLKSDEDYKRVQNAQHLTPIFSQVLLTTLKERKKNTEALLRKEQNNRQNILDHIEKCNRDLSDQKHQLELKQTSADEGVDWDMEFPANGNEELLNLAGRKKDHEKKFKPVRANYEKLEKELNIKESELKIRQTDFNRDFSPHPVDLFHEPLNMVPEKLREEEKELQEQQQELDGEQAKLQKEHSKLVDAYNQLNGKNERFGFLSEDIEAAILEGKIIANYAYQRKQMLENLFKQLDEGEQNVSRLQDQINDRRQRLVDYCNQEVRDIRMREDVKAGLRNRKTYAEVIEWHGRMQKRIQSIITIIEKDLRNHNIEMEQFIAYLHGHLNRIKEELEQIPKKTKVKVDDKWKEIYLFSVPGWHEEEGKEELRRQIYWMLGELEDGRFKDESGQEDEAKVRKAIEKWIQSKQLLRAVMKNETIKIKCRKVSNDGKVSGGIYSWEESNRWSGGEKWSKNMTLFLGILNYLAEKRQYVNQNVKRYSSVIVDNPFGKASSDHVLEPVFFVAEQLGFQIIALTAHTDGNFIRKYFPVVYSCRLRQAQGSDKLIMTKEKELKKAYFKDHDPEALERLGEYKQLTLFDLDSY
ncbi:Chromosome segregation ATPase [Desulfotomaculum arcticum]|uniref:Chromosome segregation ATPase n=1 Tax=Desulfotruncus arcticus DSM 17038 TaxID=1121424 RepID=A0A1I2PID1_9FIRM|nr:hypothetical protein [Desulfotruncus arcticus]SFG15848.1 Chromosome segregation ATPase [Desulfotomaculum arcticum] [Desulfotruncus arcticus DSM 17038]